MRNILNKLGKHMMLWLASGAGLIFFLLGTDPLKLSLPVLLVPFVLFFLWIRNGVIVLGLLTSKTKTPAKKIKFIANSLAVIALTVVTLQSLGQLSWRDILLIISLCVGLVLYFYKTDLI